MSTGIVPSFGRPGVGTARTAQRRNVSRDGSFSYFPAGGTIEGTRARDPGHSAVSTRTLRPGLVMGKITSGGFWANSIFGLSSGAITGAGTTLTVSAAAATEIVRRIGTSGTLKITGPATAGGTVRTLTATFAAVNTSTGAITITALGVNQQEDVRLNPAATGGNLQLNVAKTDGTRATTGNIAWSATDATFLSNINTALDTATGVTGGIVATAISATDTDLGFTLTYSGTGYAGLSWPEAEVAVLPTSSTSWFTAPRTTAVNGAFVTLSLVQPTDGSETPRTVVPDGYGLVVPDDDADIPFPLIPVAGCLDVTQIIDYPSDAALKVWLKQQLSTLNGGKFVFSDEF